MMPDKDRLQAWYDLALEKALVRGIAESNETMGSTFADNGCISPSDVPYIPGNIWLRQLDKWVKVRRM
ncbi:unnamed protein product [Ectocarpus sp. 8 AP-2014]